MPRVDQPVTEARRDVGVADLGLDDLQDLAVRLLAGRTAVLVTHDPLEALRVGHEIRVLYGSPFIVGAAIVPPGPMPRDPADPAALLAAYRAEDHLHVNDLGFQAMADCVPLERFV